MEPGSAGAKFVHALVSFINIETWAVKVLWRNDSTKRDYYNTLYLI